MAYPMRIAESKEQAKYIPPPKRFRKDTWNDEDSYNDLIVSKAQLLKDYPFWGILGMSIVCVEVDDPSLPTLATDGMHVFYNPKFITSLTKGERVFAFAHELMHGLLEHAGSDSRALSYLGINMERLMKEGDKAKIEEAQKKLQLWNFAADFIVNDGLVEAHVGEFIKTIQILHNDKYRGWAVEEVYEDLIENPENIPQGAQTLDQHIEIEVVPDDQMGDGESGQSRDGNGNVKVRMKQSDFDKLKKEWQDNMVSAAAAQHEHEQRESNSAGCIPSSIQRMIDELSNPRVNWRQALKRFVIAVSSRAYSFARPNKALFSQGWTLPGFRTRVNELDIVIMVDTSGSISRDQLTAFVSEMRGIMNSFHRYKIQAWCFDGDVVRESVVTLEKHTKAGDSWDQVIKFAERIGGGGGTVFSANWDYMKEKRIKPRLVLMLTDGMPFGSWGDPMYCPAMFMIIGNPGAKAPFGLTIHYEDPRDVKRAA